MICPKCNKTLEISDIPVLKVRDKILSLLEMPLTATDIKERIPEILSMGTVAYHLNNLKKEGIIIGDKQEHVRGQPTYFYLKHLKKLGYENWYELERHQKDLLKKKEIKILKNINIKPGKKNGKRR